VLADGVIGDEILTASKFMLYYYEGAILDGMVSGVLGDEIAMRLRGQ
jgi:hypothetical protein